MTIFHISGTSGSGKTFAGNILSHIYTSSKKLHVIDLDDLFYKFYKQTEKIKDADVRFVEIKNAVQSEVKKVSKRWPNVLLVGYSDVYVDGEIRYVDLNADVKYFIDISKPDLIRQFHGRPNAHILNSRGHKRKFTDTDIINMVKEDHKIYHGYTRMPQMQIIRDIILRIGK